MKILIIGTGYVGLVSGACFAELQHDVVCVDKDEKKIELINNGQMPIFETGLNELVARNRMLNRLQFVTTIGQALDQVDLVLICVGTPPLPDGQADLRFVYEAAAEIGRKMSKFTVIVTKSTVPVGTAQRIRKIIAKHYLKEFAVASCPEFLREGSAVSDFFSPDRIVIGADAPEAQRLLLQLHEKIDCPKLLVSPETAEMTKYAANAFLATKISFINEIANICENVGADVEQVAEGMGLDKRIGKQFLRAGIGYGGSCFPKDVRALQQIAGQTGYAFQLLKAVIDVNNQQRWNFFSKIKKHLQPIENKTVAIWGLSFKANTDDIRESIAIDIVGKLAEEGARLNLFDPSAMANAKRILGDDFHYCQTADEAIGDADALIICTDWDEFKSFDLTRLSACLRDKIVFDGRNIYNQAAMRQLGFNYFSIGR